MRAGVAAALLSGAPSTIASLVTRRDPLEATLAAGSIILPDERRRGALVAASVPVHLAISAFWTAVLAALLPRRRRLVEGMAAGLVIGAADLIVVARRFPRVRALPLAPQFADHLTFGVIVAFLLPERSGDR